MYIGVEKHSSLISHEEILTKQILYELQIILA
jgi:hypothetical protein